jgi:hypothetical protein
MDTTTWNKIILGLILLVVVLGGMAAFVATT